jgi:hypothetical protein
MCRFLLIERYVEIPLKRQSSSEKRIIKNSAELRKVKWQLRNAAYIYVYYSSAEISFRSPILVQFI